MDQEIKALIIYDSKGNITAMDCIPIDTDSTLSLPHEELPEEYNLFARHLTDYKVIEGKIVKKEE